jgi:hypothetical protein
MGLIKVWPRLRIIMLWVWTGKQVACSTGIIYKAFISACYIIYTLGFIIWAEEWKLFLYARWRTMDLYGFEYQSIWSLLSYFLSKLGVAKNPIFS